MDIKTKIYYLLISDASVSVKEGEFFKSQGGLHQKWGEKWEPIEAESLYDARAKGIKLRRERFPRSHLQLEETGVPMEEVWPEAKGV